MFLREHELLVPKLVFENKMKWPIEKRRNKKAPDTTNKQTDNDKKPTQPKKNIMILDSRFD
jgi:hypothetical protein